MMARSSRCEPLHGDISQNQRERTLEGFREGRFNILVATDVASRGLDVPNVDLVVRKVLPSLNEKLTRMLLCIPIVHVFVVDLTVRLEKQTTYDQLKVAIKEEFDTNLEVILGYTKDDVLTADFKCHKVECFNTEAGNALNDSFVKLLSWDVNEWGYR